MTLGASSSQAGTAHKLARPDRHQRPGLVLREAGALGCVPATGAGFPVDLLPGCEEAFCIPSFVPVRRPPATGAGRKVWKGLLPRRGPKADAATTVHREAHGLVADEIYQVQEAS